MEKKIKEIAKVSILIVATLLFCSEMTFVARQSNNYELLLNAIIFLFIIFGIGSVLARRKELDAVIVTLTVAYFVARIVSYMLNGKTITYGGAMMVQAFYLIGINRWFFGGKKYRRIALYSFLIFDIAAVLLCYFNVRFRYSYVEKLVLNHWDVGMNFGTNAFQNPNYAGMLAGAAIITCFAILMNEKFSKRRRWILLPVILLNLYTLVKYTSCRSAETGLIVVFMAFVLIKIMKRIDSIKLITGLMLVVCFLTLVPIRATVYWHDNEHYLMDISPAEQILDKASSNRYAIWKTVFLSQKNHELLGYANSSNAKDKREELLNNFDQTRVADNYRIAVEHPRQHNGYVATYNEAGILGTVLLMLLLLRRIMMLKGSFRDGKWEYLLLIYIFWINLFEAKLINATFFTGFLMMVLLMPDEESINS